MSEPIRFVPTMIFRMEVLQMTVAELSLALQQCASACSELPVTFAKNGTFQSDDYDVAVSRGPDQLIVSIAEPSCGIPILPPLSSTPPTEVQRCQFLIEAMAHRSATLRLVTETLVTQVPEFPEFKEPIRMSKVARNCNLHVTTVSRALDNKICLSAIGKIALKQFIAGFQ